MTYVPARQDTVDDQINPFVYHPKQIIKDDWALDMDPTKATDRELRAGAFAIMSEKFGILDHDGRTFSGKEHQALTGADYYAKARKAFESGMLPYTDDWIAFRQAEEAGDRAAMRKIAKENYRGESAGDDLGAFVDKVGSGFTGPTDLNGLFAGLDSIRDALSPEDAASLDAAKKESEDRWSEKEPLIKWEEMEDDEAPHVRSSSAFGGGRDWRSEERKAKDKALRDRVAGVYRKYHDTLRDEQRIAKYEKQLLDDNLFAQIARIKQVVSDDARKVLEMAQDAMDNPTSKPVLDAFQKLSTVDQRAIAGALQSLHYGRDTTLLGDCFRSFWDTTRQTVGGAIRSAADSVRQSFMDEKDYREYVERRSLLESVNRERMKEWGYLGQSVIGAFSTIPYMAAASVPYAGTAIVMASAADQFQTEAALNGVDVGSREFAIDKWLFAGAYAAVEKAQLLPFKPIGAFSRRQAYADMFGSLRNVLMVSGSIVGNTLGETVEEGVQGGIERVVESWGIPRDIARDFAAGFAQDFVDSFGTMALVGTAAAGRQAYRYRNGAIGLDKTEQLGAMAQARDTAQAMEGHPDTTPQPLARFGKVWGRLSGQWLQGGNDKDARIAIIEKWGFTHEQASEMDGFLQTMWKGASGSEELKKAFVGGNKILSAAELAAKTLKTDVRREDDGSLSILHRVGKQSLKLRFRPEDTISSTVDPETNDDGMLMSIVERLNRDDRAAGKTGDLTLEGWKALTPEQRAARVKGLRVNGNIVFESEDGATVGADALSVLSGRVILTDDAMPQTVFHEAMHGVLRILRDQAETDPEAKALQDALAKIAPAQNEKEAVNEEEFGDLFQQFLTGRVSVVEGTDWLSVFQRWVARLLGDGEAAVSDLLNKQNDVGRLFNLALTGDISPALKADEESKSEPEGTKYGTKQGEEGTKSAEDSAARASISGIYTGTAADYDKPSLNYVGTGEGSQVYGWGLYASNQRGVAEGYARFKAEKHPNVEINGISYDYDLMFGDESAEKMVSEIKHELDVEDSVAWSIHDALGYALRDYEIYEDHDKASDVFAERIRELEPEEIAARAILWTNHKRETIGLFHYGFGNLYEQTFFTDRATPEETERHLLKWYEPVSEEQLGWIDEQIDKEDYRNNVKYLLKQVVADARKAKRTDGKDLYSHIAGVLNNEPSVSGSKERATSEFLARAGIDGIKFPVDSWGGKTVKNGDKAGWNYVSFRDDNIRVDHKWVDGEQRYSISGVIGAEKLGLRGVADAEKLERDGADRETIWRQTGWWRARDGEWRVEIPDFELSANLNGSKEDLAEERKLSDREFNLMLAIRDANKDFDDFHFRRVAERLNVPEADRASFDAETDKKEKAKRRGIDRLIAEREKASRDLEALRSKKIVRALSEGRTVRLSDVIKPDSALANAFPELADIRIVAYSNLPYGVAGQFNGISIDISPALLRGDPEKFRSVLAHEVQHAIQAIEGFARGGSDELFTENVLDEDRIKDRMFSPELSNEEYAELQRQLAAIREGRGGQVFVSGRFFNSKHDAYRHLLGEAEARLVQKRLGMTPEERAARPPWEDYDVEEERLIVRYSLGHPLDFENHPNVLPEMRDALVREAAAVEDRGGLIVLGFHGTDKAGFTEFAQSDDQGYFFSKTRTTAGSYIRKGGREAVNRNALPSPDELEAWAEENGYRSPVTGEPFTYDQLLDLFANNERPSGVYDVALRMENPYVIDCHGANWDSIIDENELAPNDEVWREIRLGWDEYVGDGGAWVAEWKGGLDEDVDAEDGQEEFETYGEFRDFVEKKFGASLLDEADMTLTDERSESDVRDAGLWELDSSAVWAKDADMMMDENDGRMVYRKKTREVVADAFDMDYDGVIFENLTDNGGGVTEGAVTADDIYVVKDASQVKSIDGETYDNEGNPIPSFERLDWDKGDMRWSIGPSQFDALGTQAKAAMAELSEGRDATIHNNLGDISYEVGRPGKFTEKGKNKGGVGLLHIVYSRMAKDGVSLQDAIDIAILVADAVETGEEVERRFNKHFFRKGDIEAIVAVNPDTSKPVLTGYEIRAGEPDLAMRTSSDLRTPPPPRTEDVVAALKKRLAQLRSGVKEKVSPIEDEVTRFSLSSPVERTPDLVAFHNVREAGLRGMDELGGLAVPSFAVTKDSIGGDEFGEITLLVRPDVIDPRHPTNKAFSGDAWTPAFPSTKLRANEKKAGQIAKRFKDIFWDRRGDAWDQFAEGWSSVYGDEDYFHDLVNRTSDLEETLRDRDVFKAAFLLETGRVFELPTRDEEVFKSGFGGGFLAFVDNKVLAAIADSPLADRLLQQGESVSLDEAEALVADKGFMEQLRRIVAENTTAFDGLPEQDREDAVASWGKDEIRSYKLRDLADAIDAWRRRGGPRKVLDRGAAIQAVNEAIEANRDEFAAWIKDLVADLTDGKRYIRNERDPYTPSGRPRSFEQLYDPLTLDAVVRAMLKQQKAQGNGVFGSNPFGVAAKEFKSLGEIVKDEGRLQKLSREDVGKLKDALLERFTELATEYAATQQSPDDNRFIAFDRAADMMMDAFATAKGNKARLAKELNGWGYRASDDFVDRFSQVMQDMASMPEDYFEAKAYRAVHFDEIAEALVPDNADPATLDILRSRGVPFRTYKAGDTADRLRALNEAATAQKARFSISSSDVTTFRSMDEAVADAGKVARASISWNGPAYSHRSFATAYAARDRLLGIQRPDEDYQKLLDALGVEGLPVEELLAEADKVGREGAREDAREIAQLAGVAERRSFQKTVERMLRGSLHLGADVGAGARRAYEVYLAHVRRTAKGRDYDDFCMDLGMDPAALALSIEEAVFDPDNPAATNPATEPGAEPPTASQPGMDDDLAALLDGKAEDFGLTEDQLRERVNKRFEERTREIKERLERLRGRLDEWRRKEAERQERLAKRQQEQGKTDLDDNQMFDENGEPTEAGTKALEDYESECVEEMPDFKAFLEECRREGLDLSNAAEFVAAVRLWVEDFIARETGSNDPAAALRDPVALARYRATMMRFLHGLADSMLDPEDGAAAKIAERMMQEIPSDATVAEIDSRARVLVAFIQRNGIRQTRKQLIRELRKQIKLLALQGKKFDETERDLGRKITGEREAAARYLYRILTWSDGMIAKESRRLHDIVSGREAAYRENGATDAELNDLARTDREVHRAQERLQMLETYGGLRKKAPADIKLAARAIVEWLEEGREAHEKRWNDWRASLDNLAERIVAAASARKADFMPDDPGFVGKLADELTATVRQRLEHLFAGSGAEGRRVIDELMSLVYAGSERMRVESVRARRNADALLSRCVEGTGRSVNDFLKSLDELIPEDLNRALKTAEQPVRMTNGQALQLLASLEQTASYAANIDANGRGRFDRDGNEQTPHAVLLRRYFEDKPEMVRLLEGVREQYEERRGELSDAFLAVTGNPILSPGPLYSPVKMFMGAGEGFETSVHAWDPFGPSFAPRVKNTKDFDLRADIWDIYQSRTRETSRALAWGVVGMELRSALLRKDVQDAIARNHGKFALRQLVKQLTDVVSDGWADEPSGFKAFAQRIGNVTTYSALSWNAVTMLKQMTSIPAWTALMDGGYAEVFRNIASFDRDACKELMDAPGFVARYGSDSFAKMFKEALHDPQGGNLLKRFFSAGMTAVQIGDFVPGIVVGTGVYKARKLALMRGGMEERQARDEAARIAWGLIEECQQSSRLENTPAFLRRGGFMARQAAKFASSPLLQVSHEWHTLRMWAAEARIEAERAGRGGNLASQMWAAEGDDAKRWRRRFVNQVICNHVLMPAAMYSIATLFNMALGSEPPDEDEVLGDLVMQMLSGPFSRIFLIGMVFDKGAEAVSRMMGGKPNVYDSTGLASQQYLQKVFGQIGRIGGDVADADWESVRDDFLKMIGQVSAPARYAIKAGQNIADYDPAEARRERKAELRKAE